MKIPGVSVKLLLRNYQQHRPILKNVLQTFSESDLIEAWYMLSDIGTDLSEEFHRRNFTIPVQHENVTAGDAGG
jgi:hypothetical protein